MRVCHPPSPRSWNEIYRLYPNPLYQHSRPSPQPSLANPRFSGKTPPASIPKPQPAIGKASIKLPYPKPTTFSQVVRSRNFVPGSDNDRHNPLPALSLTGIQNPQAMVLPKKPLYPPSTQQAGRRGPINCSSDLPLKESCFPTSDSARETTDGQVQPSAPVLTCQPKKKIQADPTLRKRSLPRLVPTRDSPNGLVQPSSPPFTPERRSRSTSCCQLFPQALGRVSGRPSCHRPFIPPPLYPPATLHYPCRTPPPHVSLVPPPLPQPPSLPTSSTWSPSSQHLSMSPLYSPPSPLPTLGHLLPAQPRLPLPGSPLSLLSPVLASAPSIPQPPSLPTPVASSSSDPAHLVFSSDLSETGRSAFSSSSPFAPMSPPSLSLSMQGSSLSLPSSPPGVLSPTAEVLPLTHKVPVPDPPSSPAPAPGPSAEAHPAPLCTLPPVLLSTPPPAPNPSFILFFSFPPVLSPRTSTLPANLNVSPPQMHLLENPSLPPRPLIAPRKSTGMGKTQVQPSLPPWPWRVQGWSTWMGKAQMYPSLPLRRRSKPGKSTGMVK
ncbi:hypothetical protein AMTRI_Chr02g214070 [Amborella trichopoda]